jgi:murein endopeptidase
MRQLATRLEGDFATALEFAPVIGHANEYAIRVKAPSQNGHVKNEMTPADWDKFEKDIADAFEQDP